MSIKQESSFNIKEPLSADDLKRLSCETLWDQKPVNTTQFSTDNIIKFQIPTTDAVFDFSRSFITLDYLIPVSIEQIVNVNRGGREDYTWIDATEAAFRADITNYQNNSGVINYDTLLTMSGGMEGGIFHDVLAMLNASSIFSITEMYMDGNLIWHNDYTQAQSRLWQLNKNDEWLDSQPQSFFQPSKTQDYDCNVNGVNQLLFGDISLKRNEQLNGNLTNSDLKQQFYIRRQLKIPLVQLFPQFEVCNGWPSFLINQILYLQLTVSQTSRYLVSLLSEHPNQGPYNVNLLPYRTGSFNTTPGNNNLSTDVTGDNKPTHKYDLGFTSDNDKINFYFNGMPISIQTKDGTNPVQTYNYTGALLAFDIKNIMLENVRLYTPMHTPEFKERQEFKFLVDNGGLTYGFKYHNILNSNVDLSYGQGNNTRAMSFNSAVNNIEAVSILTMRDGTEVVYDKPGMSAIQCNLGNNWLLATSGTHVDSLYIRDSDILTDLLKGWGQLDKRYMGTISEDVIKSYKFDRNYLRNATGIFNFNGLNNGNHTITNIRPSYGAYIQYYDASPGDEIGVAAGQYSRLINMRWTNDANLGNAGRRSNYHDAKMYICQQTYSTLMITSTSVFIANPFAEDFEPTKIIQTYRNLNYSRSGLRTHGIGTAVMTGVKAVPGVIGGFTKLAGGIADLDHKLANRRATKFHQKALMYLGEDGYKKYLPEINYYGTKIKPISNRHLKKWRKEWAANKGNPNYEKKYHGIQTPPFVRGPPHMLRRYRVMSFRLPHMGWRGGINRRPIRLMPFARLGVDGRSGDPTAKHGLCQAYHGLQDDLTDAVKKGFKKYVPEPIQQGYDKLKPYINPIIEKPKKIIEEKISKIDPSTRKKIETVYTVGKVIAKKLKLGQRIKGFFRRIFHRRRHGYYASTIAHGIPIGILARAPHMKRISSYYSQRYQNKNIKNLAKLERAVWKLGNKRAIDGRF